MATYAYQHFAYRTPPELGADPAPRRPVVIVGAGPVGLAAAIDLAQRGVASVLLDDNDVVSVGSRAICWAKRTLEICDRLGVGERMLAKGVTWQVGRVYHRDRELYHFDLLPEGGHRMPAFINLQQYYVEQYLVERAHEFPQLIDLRWKHRVTGVVPAQDEVIVEIDTPDGPYTLRAEWLLAADGAKSSIREELGIPFDGHTFEEKFLIADVRLTANFPSDRRFWFQPTFDSGDSVLIHRQPDDVFRIDFQLGWDADAERERQPERVMARVRGVVGTDVPCEFEWSSVYTFRCARMARFVHGRVVFVGDSAHVVSPFGARGGNGGLQDVDNLCWKLARILRGEAPPALIDSYDRERVHGANENLRNSSRTTTFMTPKSQAERQMRDGVLALASVFPFARALVNSGRLSRPCDYRGLAGVAPDDSRVAGTMAPGMPCLDAPVTDREGRARWLLGCVGPEATVLTFVADAAEARAVTASLSRVGVPDLAVLLVAAGPLAPQALPVLIDAEGLVGQRYGGAPGVTYLLRPDQHVLARWPQWEPERVGAVWRHALTGAVE